MGQEPHSASQFTPSRDLWWHADYLDLLARRLGLSRCTKVLELGAGVGHWTTQLIGRCADAATFTLVDREQTWVDRLNARFAGKPGFVAIRADVADLSALPSGFDLVTCQTLLMHVADVPGALAQMKQRLKPGGLLLLVEPNNFLNRLPTTSTLATLSPVEFGQLAAFWWAFEQGRGALGFGREWIPELLPKMIADCGFTELQVFQNDRVWPWAPPYRDAEATAVLGEEPSEQQAIADREEARRFVRAAGYDEAAFESGWRLTQDVGARVKTATADAAFSSAGAGHMYVFAARRPR